MQRRRVLRVRHVVAQRIASVSRAKARPAEPEAGRGDRRADGQPPEAPPIDAARVVRRRTSPVSPCRMPQFSDANSACARVGRNSHFGQRRLRRVGGMGLNAPRKAAKHRDRITHHVRTVACPPRVSRPRRRSSRSPPARRQQPTGGVPRLTAADAGPIRLRHLDAVNAARGPAGPRAAAALGRAQRRRRHPCPRHVGAEARLAFRLGPHQLARARLPRRLPRRGASARTLFEGADADLTVLRYWLEVPDTRRVIIDPAGRGLGLGWYQDPGGKIWWVQLVGPELRPGSPSGRRRQARMVIGTPSRRHRPDLLDLARWSPRCSRRSSPACACRRARPARRG